MLIRCAFYGESMAGAIPPDRQVGGLSLIIHRLLAGPLDGVNVVEGPARRPRRRSAPMVAAPVAEHARDLRPRGAKTRQKLLDAGATVLPLRGYHDARVDDIVEVAGVSHGSFYRYFENKDDFFRVLAEEASTRMIELLDEFPADADTDALHAWLADWFATYESNGGVISTWQEMHSADPALIDFSQQVAAAVIARLVAVLDQRLFGDSQVEALALLALIERTPYSVYTLGFTQQAQAIDAMVTIIRRGFMGLPGTP
jgi:AcrR family transcriptional regulator